MVRPLLSANALASIRRIGEGQMVTEVEIYRTTVIEVGGTGYDVNYDYGDDELLDAEVSEYDEPVGTALAWIQTPSLVREATSEDDQITTVDIHEIKFPIGTDIRVHDVVKRVDNGEEFVIVDTNAGDTWASKLRTTARHREG